MTINHKKSTTPCRYLSTCLNTRNGQYKSSESATSPPTPTTTSSSNPVVSLKAPSDKKHAKHRSQDSAGNPFEKSTDKNLHATYPTNSPAWPIVRTMKWQTLCTFLEVFMKRGWGTRINHTKWILTCFMLKCMNREAMFHNPEKGLWCFGILLHGRFSTVVTTCLTVKSSTNSTSSICKPKFGPSSKSTIKAASPQGSTSH